MPGPEGISSASGEIQQQRELALSDFKTPSGLMLVCSGDIQDPRVAHQTDRALQRLSQFERVLRHIDNLGNKIRNSQNVDPNDTTALWLLKRITASWYIYELSQEDLTQSTALDLNNKLLPDKDKAIVETELVLRRNGFYMSDIFEEVNHTLCPPIEREIDPKDKELIIELAEKQSEKVNLNNDKGGKAASTVTDPEGIKNALQVLGKPVSYIHDPVLDEPSKEAADYVRRLFDRSF